MYLRLSFAHLELNAGLATETTPPSTSAVIPDIIASFRPLIFGGGNAGGYVTRR